jgi:hypothetical protein
MSVKVATLFATEVYLLVATQLVTQMHESPYKYNGLQID